MHAIPYQPFRTEFEVQAWLYMTLRAQGRDVRGEVKTLYEQKKGRVKARFCRFDLVEYVDKKAVRIFEVKARPVRHKDGVEGTRQGQRYPRYGVPVTFVYGMEDAMRVAGVAHGDDLELETA